DVWKKWEGQVVDHKFQLQRYLGSTDHSVVFLAEFHDPEPKQAAVKFISAEFGNKDEQIASWKEAAKLTHPNLIRIYGAGTCKIEDRDVLYVAMEYAEENLSQVLPSRPLSAEEASESLNAMVDVLVYLHGKNLVHGHVKPSNILANAELLKLSSDTIFPAGEVREMRRERTAYDAPELPVSPYTPAADVWSLGATLVEALTQQHALLPFNEHADPIIPDAVREPYLEIVRQTLRREPRLRWTSSRIAERLNPTAVAARSVAAGVGTSARVAVASAPTAGTATTVAPPAPPVMAPLQMPDSNEPVAPPIRTAPAVRVRPTPPRVPARQEEVRREAFVLPNYVIPLFAGLLGLVLLVTLPFLLRHKTVPQTGQPAATSATNVAQPSPSVTPDANSNISKPQPIPAPETQLPPSKVAAESPAVIPSRSSVPAPTPAPAAVRSKETPPATTPVSKTSGVSTGKGAVLDQTKPEAAAKALATIHGTVRVGVKVHVDAAGNVSNASLDNAGPSRYFSDLSLKAARQWVFTPPESDGKSVPSDWKLQFHYTQSGVQMSSEQVAP
ncbi:MAG TPA: TonB family protein, partial [Candidatus Acidoferrum sp.]|nr:TonB family protein [Candidatus Acidoferrum sp.]